MSEDSFYNILHSDFNIELLRVGCVIKEPCILTDVLDQRLILSFIQYLTVFVEW